MAQVAFEVLDIAIQLGFLIAGLIKNTKEEQDYRNQWTPGVVEALSQKPENKGKNIMLVYTDHEWEKDTLKGNTSQMIKCTCPTKTELAYTAYIFDEGIFHLKGDGYVS